RPGHLLLGRAHASYGGVEAAGGEHAVASGHVEVTGARILREVADRADDGRLPGGRERLAGDGLGERGLPGAVAADETDLVAGRDAERGAGQQQARTGTKLEIADSDHRRTFRSR